MTPKMIIPKFFSDPRGWFVESWTRQRYAAWGISSDFCQDNHSYSRFSGTIRGLHFQRKPHTQAKLVRCVQGRIFDVAVDLRQGSPSFGKWISAILTAERGEQLFVPSGFAHGFQTLEDHCEVIYKVDNYYAPEADAGVVWNDPAIGIDWPLNGSKPLLSEKDSRLPLLSEVQLDFAYEASPLHALEVVQ
jgi:dTDP-4-dehydrorhamnose 3,5-epimerase